MHTNRNSYFFIAFVFPFLPIIFFLNKTNFPQLFLSEIIYIIFFQLLVFFFLIFFSVVIYKLLSKKISLSLIQFISVNSLIFYLLFFYKKINLIFTYFFEETNIYLDNILTLFLYFVIYFLIIKFIKKKIFLIFSSFYLFLNLLLLFINIYQFNIVKLNFDNFKIFQSNNDLKNLNLEKVSSSKNSENIFFIILDGMPSIYNAKKMKLIENENKIINQLNDLGLNYVENFSSNYSNTFLSIESLLNSTYPVLEGEPKESINRKIFYPYSLNSNENIRSKILELTNRTLIWIGSWRANCKKNQVSPCFVNYNFMDSIYLKVFPIYRESIFIILFNLILGDILKDDAANVSFNFLQDEKNYLSTKSLLNSPKSLYLIHVDSPHAPHNFDKNCKRIKKHKKDLTDDQNFIHFSYAYGCTLDLVLNWVSKINSIEKNNLIFIFADHGMKLDKKRMNDLKKDYGINKYDTIFETFFAYQIPSRCKNLEVPKTLVNLMRFSINCAENLNLEYLEDYKFLAHWDLFIPNNDMVIEYVKE